MRKDSGFFLEVGDVRVGKVQMRLDTVPDFAPPLGHGHRQRVDRARQRIDRGGAALRTAEAPQIGEYHLGCPVWLVVAIKKQQAVVAPPRGAFSSLRWLRGPRRCSER